MFGLLSMASGVVLTGMFIAYDHLRGRV